MHARRRTELSRDGSPHTTYRVSEGGMEKYTQDGQPQDAEWHAQKKNEYQLYASMVLRN
jgi:hypothetical protein